MSVINVRESLKVRLKTMLFVEGDELHPVTSSSLCGFCHAAQLFLHSVPFDL